jgi:hypothetical protein
MEKNLDPPAGIIISDPDLDRNIQVRIRETRVSDPFSVNPAKPPRFDDKNLQLINNCIKTPDISPKPRRSL